jgi:hypothetical protein
VLAMKFRIRYSDGERRLAKRGSRQPGSADWLHFVGQSCFLVMLMILQVRIWCAHHPLLAFLPWLWFLVCDRPL